MNDRFDRYQLRASNHAAFFAAGIQSLDTPKPMKTERFTGHPEKAIGVNTRNAQIQIAAHLADILGVGDDFNFALLTRAQAQLAKYVLLDHLDRKSRREIRQDGKILRIR